MVNPKHNLSRQDQTIDEIKENIKRLEKERISVKKRHYTQRPLMQIIFIALMSFLFTSSITLSRPNVYTQECQVCRYYTDSRGNLRFRQYLKMK